MNSPRQYDRSCVWDWVRKRLNFGGADMNLSTAIRLVTTPGPEDDHYE